MSVVNVSSGLIVKNCKLKLILSDFFIGVLMVDPFRLIVSARLE